MGSDARVVRSVNIAAIVLCGLSLFCAVALLIFMGLSSTMLTDPQVMAGVIDKLDSGSSAFDGNSYATEFDYGGLTPAEASAMATAGFAVLIALILGFVGLKVVALIAAIIAVRNYTNPARYGRIFGWAIAAAITSLLIGAWVSLVLYVISAVFSYRAKKSASAMGSPFDAGAGR